MMQGDCPKGYKQTEVGVTGRAESVRMVDVGATGVGATGRSPLRKFNPEIHHRRSIRLKGYDYSQDGAYFITICVHNRETLFGEIVDSEMRMNDFGRIVEAEWIKSAEMRAEIELGEFVVMPNHFHGIVHIVGDGRGDRRRGDRPVAPTPATAIVPGPRPKSIGALLAGFKSAVTLRINIVRQTPRHPVWQRNYYEHIIRDEADYVRIAEYVATNPRRWKEDALNPENADVGATDVRMVDVGATGVGATGRSPLRKIGQPGGGDE
jgi:REP element-mobilizing transposase RayT